MTWFAIARVNAELARLCASGKDRPMTVRYLFVVNWRQDTALTSWAVAGRASFPQRCAMQMTYHDATRVRKLAQARIMSGKHHYCQ
jgi:hypothetical protein